jgi:RimJ/RimL family protein N-acetyltransferase
MARCSNCCLPIELQTANKRGETEHLCQPCINLADDTTSISVSPLDKNDLELVLAWRSNPEIYRHFRKQNDPLDWDEHVKWFESRTPSRYDFIIHYNGRRVGVVNIGSDNDVGIYLGDCSARGRGIATNALNWLCERFDDRRPLIAEIHESNEASQRLFRRCGFEEAQKEGEWIKYWYHP